MPGKSKTDKRSRLIQTAGDLTYRRGFAKASLADIAREAEVPLGNVYYYFKTKGEIGEAIIEQHLDTFRNLRQEWEREESPQSRLVAFIQMTVSNRSMLARSGCPVGSLCAELGKDGGQLAKTAARPFEELLSWLEAQFSALGRGREKKALAVHLLSALQGVSLLANCFEDEKLVVTEGNQLKRWVLGL